MMTAEKPQVEMIKPPNTIKTKVGSGGIDEKQLEKAQKSIESNTVDFRPIAKQFIADLAAAIDNTRAGKLQAEAAVEAMIYPAMQMKAQGSMLHYMLATDISDILVNFLESVTAIDTDVLDIADAHKKTLELIILKEIKNNTGPVADQFKKALTDACNRYYAKHPAA